MTWKISIELDCTHTQAQTVYDDIANWAHEGHPIELPDVTRWSPAVSLEPHHPDDAELAEAVQHLRRLKFDTAAEAVQAARRNLTPKPPRIIRINALQPHPLLVTGSSNVLTAMRKADDDTERRLHARAATDTHQARGGRIL